jgi:hypothetical protein
VIEFPEQAGFHFSDFAGKEATSAPFAMMAYGAKLDKSHYLAFSRKPEALLSNSDS